MRDRIMTSPKQLAINRLLMKEELIGGVYTCNFPNKFHTHINTLLKAFDAPMK